MLIGAQKHASHFVDIREPRSVRFFRRVIGADVNKLSFPKRSARHETTWTALTWDNAAWQLTRMATIPLVLLVGCLSQVFPTVICGIAVFVIDSFRWPFAGLHDPNQTMCGKLAAIYEKANMAIAVRQSRRSAGPSRVPDALRFLVLKMVQWPEFPNQYSNGWLICEAFMQIRSARPRQFISRIWIVLRTLQVVPSVIRYVSVLVFNDLCPRAGLHNPNQTMPSEDVSIYVHPAFTIALKQTDGFAGPSLIPTALGCRILKMIQRTRFPFENASLVIIRKTLTQVSL